LARRWLERWWLARRRLGLGSRLGMGLGLAGWMVGLGSRLGLGSWLGLGRRLDLGPRLGLDMALEAMGFRHRQDTTLLESTRSRISME